MKIENSKPKQCYKNLNDISITSEVSFDLGEERKMFKGKENEKEIRAVKSAIPQHKIQEEMFLNNINGPSTPISTTSDKNSHFKNISNTENSNTLSQTHSNAVCNGPIHDVNKIVQKESPNEMLNFTMTRQK